MKVISTISLAISSLLFDQTASANTVHFEINEIKSDTGKLYVQIFKGQTNYQKSIAELSTIANAKKGKVTITFNDLTAGEYAIRFFHDEDNDGKLATNLFGIPSEGYGFSNDAKPNFGPVSFENAKFTLDGENSVVVNKTTAIY